MSGTPAAPVHTEPAGAPAAAATGTSTARLGGALNGVGHASYAVDMVDAAAHGDYKRMAGETAIKVVTSTETYDAAGKLVSEAGWASKALGFMSKSLPIVGGVMLAINDGKEVYDHIKKGDYKGAALAGALGVMEVGATTFGGPVGALASQAVREVIVDGVAAAGGPKLNHAALVQAGMEAYHVAHEGYNAASKFMSKPDPAKIEAQQQAVLHADNVLPKAVKLNGHEVPLETALRNPVFNKSFRENLMASDRAGHLHAAPLIATINQFDNLEKQRVAAVAATAPHQPQPTQQAAARAPAHPAAAHA